MLLYHVVPSRWGLQNIERRRGKAATLDALNDPFEMLAATSPSPAHRAAFRRAKAERAAAVGLLCFSRSWSNPVQWPHYADRHRGLCLGFEVDDAVRFVAEISGSHSIRAASMTPQPPKPSSRAW